MVRRIALMVICCLLLQGCSALPAEERSFAVALGFHAADNVWYGWARIPNYQEEGGYLTVAVQGASLQESLARLDAAAPMRMHFGQVRLLIFSRELAASDAFTPVLETLAQRADLRLQAQVCVTESDLSAVMNALAPQTGTRLSKSLDVTLETRRDLGVIPQAGLSTMMRMGERESPVLVDATLDEAQGQLMLSGGWLVDASGRAVEKLTAGEMQTLCLMQDRLQKTTLLMDGRAVTLSDARCSVTLDGNSVLCDATLRYTTADLNAEGVAQQVQETMQHLAEKLAAAGCDALGLGGYAIRHFRDMASWEQLNWPDVYSHLVWTIRIQAEPPT